MEPLIGFMTYEQANELAKKDIGFMTYEQFIAAHGDAREGEIERYFGRKLSRLVKRIEALEARL